MIRLSNFFFNLNVDMPLFPLILLCRALVIRLVRSRPTQESLVLVNWLSLFAKRLLTQ